MAGTTKESHIEEVELPKPVAVIPHQGNRVLTRASIPAITPRKFTRGSVVVKESPTASLKTTTNRWISSVFDRNLRPELAGFSSGGVSAFCNPSNLVGNDHL